MIKMNYIQSFLSKVSYFKPLNKVKVVPPWWVKISTSQPKCVYYFGSFNDKSEAMEALPGYVEDLEQEQAAGILVEIKQEHPQLLTISEE